MDKPNPKKCELWGGAVEKEAVVHVKSVSVFFC